MDNFHIDITAEGKTSLQKAIEIAFAHNAPGRKAESYSVVTLAKTVVNDLPHGLDGKTALILRWSGAEKQLGAVNLKLDVEGAVDFATRWLAEQNFGREPDHDGDNGRGWRVFVGAWGHVGGDHYAILGIVPSWAMYGK
ncbi:hypothetical protein [Rhizobium redzepovicii]|uniref:hypothetical protein n=1 Tax=Rhizobium redzepovicii TaxID=2867518 RepID=UPI002870BE88|nr:hypothetical protein [Rhizobium redzepovicii]MDR9781847.1 hypothetical protein [Rhizobium redzepovicii]